MTTNKKGGFDYYLQSWSVQKDITNPIRVKDAEGIYFWDENGKKYYDMTSQSENLNLGHKHPKLIQAIIDQAQIMPFINSDLYIPIRDEAAKKIVDASGMEGAKVFFTNAGAEANENAIKMAREYTGKWKIFSAYRSYHGATAGAGNLTGEPRRFINEPGGPGFIKFEGPYAYRAPRACKFENEEDVTNYYLEILENQIKYEGPEQIAAIWLETVVGTNGILIPPKGYLPGVRALCDKYNILMVCDEVMAGWYRTGKAFAFQNFGAVPDLVSFAKGSTTGYVPLGGVIVSKDICDYFYDKKLFCGLTYTGHPIGCAVASRTIDVYTEEKIPENVAKVGAIQAQLMDEMLAKHPCLGEVRHIGLFGAFEVVKDKESRIPMCEYNNDTEGVMGKIEDLFLERGIYTYAHENIIHCNPPLNITEEELREALAIYDEVWTIVDNTML